MLFAEMTAQDWVLIIGAVFLGITQVLSMVLSYRRDRDKTARDEAVDALSKKRERRRLRRERAATKRAKIIAEKAASTDEKISTLVHQTNSMKDELVKEVRSAGFAQGVKVAGELLATEPPKVVEVPKTDSPPTEGH